MQLNFIGQSVEVTPALRTLVEEKFEKVKRHFDHITSAHVTLNVQKLNHTAEITVVVPKHQFHSTGTAEDMYKAVDLMINSLDSQVRKHKEKLSHHHRGE